MSRVLRAEEREGVKAKTPKLFWAACALAASFLVARFVETPQPIGAIWKASGIALLGVFALTRGARLAAFGLFVSAAGDFFLELDPPIWIGGMAAFGVAHVFYALAFIDRLYTDGRAPFGPLAAGVAVIFSVGSLAWFLPGMDALLVPGLAYHLIITAMVGFALLSRASLAARAGAVVFLASDAVIALELYKGFGPFGPLNWLLYAPAQMLIAWGLSRPRLALRRAT